MTRAQHLVFDGLDARSILGKLVWYVKLSLAAVIGM